MALLVFGPPETRRAYIAVMRLVATALGTRPFVGDEAELVTMFAALEGCAGCHGFDEPLDFSDLLGVDEPWADSEAAIVEILKGTEGGSDDDDVPAICSGVPGIIDHLAEELAGETPGFLLRFNEVLKMELGNVKAILADKVCVRRLLQ